MGTDRRADGGIGAGWVNDEPVNGVPVFGDGREGDSNGVGPEGALYPEDGFTAPPPAAELTEPQLEALLFVAERPLSRREIAASAGVDRATVDARLGDLEISLRNRGIRLISSGDQVELVTAPEAGSLIARYVGSDAIRLSQASLETLAIIAYRQPVTKAVIERIRGVDSDYTVRALVHRRLALELGRAEGPGRPILYGTGFDFLERFGLTSLDDLPALDAEVAGRLAAELADEAQVADEARVANEAQVADEAAGAQVLEADATAHP